MTIRHKEAIFMSDATYYKGIRLYLTLCAHYFPVKNTVTLRRMRHTRMEKYRAHSVRKMHAILTTIHNIRKCTFLQSTSAHLMVAVVTILMKY